MRRRLVKYTLSPVDASCRRIADLHLHSHYSLSTSPLLDLPHLDTWAARKGIGILGTGDFTHPGWRAEIARELRPAEEGLFVRAGSDTATRFVLSAEISSIYRYEGRVRKVHNLLLAPSFDAVDTITRAVARFGSLVSDGRPILRLDSRDLLEIVLTASPDAELIPAHIWTPWYSVLGARSGFDSLRECYRDLTPHIHAAETGLSSDPPMNWMSSALDGITLVSSSDAHSPERLGREANLLDIDLSYPALLGALRGGTAGGFVGTVELFPEEGKYYHDGHRACEVRRDPVTAGSAALCEVCGRPLTTGVLRRVLELADRPYGYRPEGAPEHTPLVPLKEILAEVRGRGTGTKVVDTAYHRLLERLGPELGILLHRPIEVIEREAGDRVAEAVRRVRARAVTTEPGYDGVYGVVRVLPS